MKAIITVSKFENGRKIEEREEIGEANYYHWDEWKKLDKSLGAETRLYYGGCGLFEKYISKMGNRKVIYKMKELIYK